MKLGREIDTEITQGPLVNIAVVGKVKAHVVDALSHGGKPVTGGARPNLPSYFFEPTVITGATPVIVVTTDKTFGLLTAVFLFEDEAYIIAQANTVNIDFEVFFSVRT